MAAGNDQFDVSVIVPALNEAESLPELFSRCAAVFDKLNMKAQYVLIDDGSTDDTREIVKKLCEEYEHFVAIHHNTKHGKSIALMQGFEEAQGDVAITLDADLQDLPEMIPTLLEKLDEGFDLVNGYRINRQDHWSRKLVSKGYNTFVSKVFGSNLHDINCGLKAMRKPVYKSIELYGDLHRLMPVLADSLAFKTTEAAVDHADRKYGESRYTLFRHRGFLDVVSLLVMNKSESRPFHFFCEVAFFFWVVSVLSFISWVLIAVTTQTGISHNWRIVSALLGGISAWSAFVGTILPLFGFFLEFETRRVQDAEWRRQHVQSVQRSGSPS